MTDSTKKNNNTLTLLLLLLITSIGANFYQWKSHSSMVVSHGNEVDSLQTLRLNVERELGLTSIELEKYRGIAGNLDTLLNEANSQIAMQEEKIKKLLANEKDGKKLSEQLKLEIAKLHKLRDEYLDKIDGLMAENDRLKTANDSLNTELVNLNEQKNLLVGKVATAAQLKAEYVKVNSYKKKLNGKYTESALAKRTNKLDACFTLMDNKIASTGDKMIYLLITAPDGKILMSYTKAQFTDSEGNALDATASIKIDYTGAKQDICLSYENDERILEPGTYQIGIYADGLLVHQSNYILR
jgi:predicted  nucleic acid-binding Zn-ribbon protein